jgi:hypothetical protein
MILSRERARGARATRSRSVRDASSVKRLRHAEVPDDADSILIAVRLPLARTML